MGRHLPSCWTPCAGALLAAGNVAVAYSLLTQSVRAAALQAGMKEMRPQAFRFRTPLTPLALAARQKVRHLLHSGAAPHLLQQARREFKS